MNFWHNSWKIIAKIQSKIVIWVKKPYHKLYKVCSSDKYCLLILEIINFSSSIQLTIIINIKFMFCGQRLKLNFIDYLWNDKKIRHFSNSLDLSSVNSFIFSVMAVAYNWFGR
jgi:hypothetical protein